MTTLNELVALIAEEAGVRAAAAAPAGLAVLGWPAPLCEAVCAPFGIEPPLYRRRVDFFTKSRAFDIDRARARARATRRGRPARGHPADARVVHRQDGWSWYVGSAASDGSALIGRRYGAGRDRDVEPTDAANRSRSRELEPEPS